MKETKVYVDDELLIYDDFSLCCTKNFDNTFYTNNYSLIDNEEYFEAYFQSIKSHDRELVKEVCEKIREHLSEQKKSLKDTFSPYSNGKAFIISAVEDNLNKIEKEFEDGE